MTIYFTKKKEKFSLDTRSSFLKNVQIIHVRTKVFNSQQTKTL